MKNIIKIVNRKIGEKFKPFIICELGINHNGSLKLAKKMVDLVIKSGADAIKNQSHILDKEIIPETKKIKKPKNKKKFILRKGGSSRKFINVINKKSFWLTSRQKYFVKN